MPHPSLPPVRGQIIRLHPDATNGAGTSTLQLVRSFDIPTSDPSYVRLLNWSWTYDSAISAAAFEVAGRATVTANALVTAAIVSVAHGPLRRVGFGST